MKKSRFVVVGLTSALVLGCDRSPSPHRGLGQGNHPYATPTPATGSSGGGGAYFVGGAGRSGTTATQGTTSSSGSISRGGFGSHASSAS